MSKTGPEQNPASSSTSARPLGRIMSLDDEVIDQMMCKRVVKRSGIASDVVSFSAPDAALTYLADPDSAQVDLILLDVNMPRMNGFEFLVAAQDFAKGDDLPPVLVMLTTPLGPIHLRQAEGLASIKGYLNKPLDQAELEQAIVTIQAESASDKTPPMC